MSDVFSREMERYEDNNNKIKDLSRQVTELQDANNKYLQRARDAEAALAKAQQRIEYLTAKLIAHMDNYL